MNLNEVAKQYTRKDFLNMTNEERGYLFHGGNCPSSHGLNCANCREFDINDNNCTNLCWKQAIKYIKFKDDLKGENMKKLNIIEAMKMPIGTEFKVIFNGEQIENNTMIIYKSLDDVATKHIDWVCHPQDSFIKPYDFLINGVFIPIQKPVSFMEVVNSEKDCRIEHPLLDIVIPTEEDNSYYYEFNNKGYLPLNCLLHILGGHLGVREVKEVILEGKWYIEED